MNLKEPVGRVLPNRRYRKVCERKGHKLRSVLTGYMEYAICCKRFRCEYMEINPNGFMAELIDRDAEANRIRAAVEDSRKKLEEACETFGYRKPPSEE